MKENLVIDVVSVVVTHVIVNTVRLFLLIPPSVSSETYLPGGGEYHRRCPGIQSHGKSDPPAGLLWRAVFLESRWFGTGRFLCRRREVEFVARCFDWRAEWRVDFGDSLQAHWESSFGCEEENRGELCAGPRGCREL